MVDLNRGVKEVGECPQRAGHVVPSVRAETGLSVQVQTGRAGTMGADTLATSKRDDPLHRRKAALSPNYQMPQGQKDVWFEEATKIRENCFFGQVLQKHAIMTAMSCST